MKSDFAVFKLQTIAFSPVLDCVQLQRKGGFLIIVKDGCPPHYPSGSIRSVPTSIPDNIGMTMKTDLNPS